MIYLPIERLKPGMILARSLPSGNVAFSLLNVGQRLTGAALARLDLLGVQGAYVEWEGADGVEPGELIDPQFKAQFLVDVHRLCDDYVDRCSPGRLYSSAARMAVDLVDQVLASDEVLLNVIDIKDYDTYTFRHSMSVGTLSVLIGTRLGLGRGNLIELALSGLMHDIGKLDIPAEIVNKPGPLTSEEALMMMRHPALAIDRLSGVFPAAVCGAIATHHEKYDGTGYPRGLKGEGIPLYGRILSMADVYDALTSNRPYRAAWSPDRAIEYMVGCSGTCYDPELLDQFLCTVAAYPVGTVVRLSDGSRGLVTANTPGQVLRPTVRLLEPPDRRGTVLDLAGDHSLLNVTVERTEDCGREYPLSLADQRAAQRADAAPAR